MSMTYTNARDILERQRFIIASGPMQWRDFLSSTCTLTSYGFVNQIMIAAQRINPTAVASYNYWNDKQECAVIKGRKGIAIFDSRSGGIRYVFDAKDVREIHDKSRDGHKPVLWKYKEHHKDTILSFLRERYGEYTITDPDMDIKDAVKNSVSDALCDFLIQSGELSEMEIDVQNLILASTIYVVQSRMGLTPEAINFPEFNNISRYALQPEMLTKIGDITQKVSYSYLREIGQLVSDYNREHLEELNGVEALISDSKDQYDKLIEDIEKNSKIGLANASESVHNAFSTSREEEVLQNGERTDIFKGGRLSVSEHYDRSSSGGAAEEVREDETEFSDREKILVTSDVIDGGTASSPLSGDSAPGAGENGRIDSRASESREDNRGNEGHQSNGLGGSTGKGTVTSRGNGTKRDNLRLEFSGEEPQYEQLSLFAPSEMEQIGSIMSMGSHTYETVPEGYSLFLNDLKDILRSGTNQEQNRNRIWNQYSIGKSPEEITNFLKTEYKRCGKGFTIGGHRISIFADNEGIHFGYGESAFENPISVRTGAGREDVLKGVLSYEEAERIIRRMVREGDYLSESEAYLTPEILLDTFSDNLSLYTRDFGSNGKMFSNDEKWTYPDRKDSYKEALSTPEGIREVFDNLTRLKNGIDHGEIVPRFRFLYGIDTYISQITDMMRDREDLPANKEVSYPEVDFITQDEIDGAINRGSGFSEGTFRIFEYFNEEHTSKEKAEFLKNEYGIGGGSNAIPGAEDSWNDHDSKGVTIKKGDISNPYANITLTYSALAKRIDRLIKEGRYLSAAQKEKYSAWKEEKAQEALKATQKNFEISQKRACADALEDLYHAAEKDSQLDTDALNQIIEEHGKDTVTFVLANTILRHENEGMLGIHFTPEHLNVAKKVLPDRDYMDPLYSKTPMYPQQRKEDGTHDYSVQMDYRHFENMVNQMCDSVFILEQTQEKSAQQIVQDQKIADDTEETLGWHIIHEADDDSGQPTEWSAKLPNGEFLWIDKEAEGYALYDTANTDASPVSVSETLDGAKESGEDYALELTAVELENTENILSEPLTTTESAIYPGDKNELPYDIVIEKMNFGEPEHTEPEKEPEIDKSGAVNFHITDAALGMGSPKEKFQNNIQAIKTLKKIEGENREATRDEQLILSKYIGWGGLSDAFDDNKSGWADENRQLKEILKEEEYAAAKKSTLDAFYTSPVIITQIYRKLSEMGFEGGSILEPSCAVGNFFGCMPEEIRNNSSLTGVEIDSISGRIASKLYPSADINITGYEDTVFANDTFDLAIGNVPFGDFKVFDRDYAKENFLIHDYFFAKTLDKVRPGGVVAFITSKGTLDKQSDAVRKLLAEKAEFLGAVRLPDTAFKANAGTEVTSDIIFLKKREDLITLDDNNLPAWCQVAEDPNGITMNKFFIEHPENIVGRMVMESGRFGPVSACKYDNDDIPFSAALRDALSNGIHGTIEKGLAQIVTENNRAAITKEAPREMRNFSYAVMDGVLYYKNNSVLEEVKEKPETLERIKAMCDLRDTVHDLLNCQLEDNFNEQKFLFLQKKLNSSYDKFDKQYGKIASRINKKAFEDDSAYCLLRSLEKYDDDGNYTGKTAIFSKRTVRPKITIDSCENAIDALSASLCEKGRIDFNYMQSLLEGKSIDDIKAELSGLIFQNPSTRSYETAEEYLSGNVRAKLEYAEEMVANGQEEFVVNVKALKEVQPEPIKAAEIAVRLGSTWIEPKYIQQFMEETFQIPFYQLRSYGNSLPAVGVTMNKHTNEWNVRGKSLVRNALVESTYGTSRRNALAILEDSLNLRDSRVYDHLEDPVTQKEKSVLNQKETLLAQQKQELLKEKFCDWIFAEPERREYLVNKYNAIFNSTRPRTYDGSHLSFNGIAYGIGLKPHQADAVARIVYGGNTLLAHAVGAGKTFEMAAAAMESKRLGLCHKSLFVVPNHITEQWGSEFMKLYPNANILVATKKDFEPARRKEFCSRIATGDYDAVIIGHTQFERIPLSKETKVRMQQKQLDEIMDCIKETAAIEGKRSPSVKQLEKSARSIEAKLKELSNAPKDDVVTFEQMGIDRLFVDESHNYKNLYIYTKMRNVAGISTTEAKKSSDLYDKCQYLDEITGYRGTIFASGTPISNSMTELYTNMRYLQRNKLFDMGLQNFDAWASTFGETQTAMELTPEGKGYKPKTRFSKFFNLPELMNVFKECADVRTLDMLNLDVPEAQYIDVVTEPTEHQRNILNTFVERAEKVRSGMVDPSVDNMLKITNDGRMMALDQRLINPILPDDPNSKVNACVEKAFGIWNETKEERLTQIIFCDLSTPNKAGNFNVYDDIKKKLIAKGVPEKEIAFIHDANTELQKAQLFGKVRSGEVRFIFGSTQKIGAGTNIQHKLVALHHLDVPWRPSDIEQQEGRIVRQHNQNEKVKIFRYITKDTFDAYSWQTIENKQKFIGQIMTSKSPVRVADDVDEQALNYAEIKALATGNPLIKEKMDLDLQVNKLKMLKASYNSAKFELQDRIAKILPERITKLKSRIEGFKTDMRSYGLNKEQQFSIKIGSNVYSDKKEAGEALIEICSKLPKADVAFAVGEYCGFQLNVTFDSLNKTFNMGIKGELSHKILLSDSATGNMTRIENCLENLSGELKEAEVRLDTAMNEFKIANEEVNKPFEKEEELRQKRERLIEVNKLLEEQDNQEFNREEDASVEQKVDMKLSTLLLNSEKKFTIHDTEFDMEMPFYGTKSRDSKDARKNNAMFELATMIDVTEYNAERSSVMVDFSGLIERNMDALEAAGIFEVCTYEDIMNNLPYILENETSELRLDKFISVLKDSEFKQGMKLRALQNERSCKATDVTVPLYDVKTKGRKNDCEIS